MAAAMNFVPSITEPPPTARRKSTPSAFACATAFMQVSYRGFGSMPANSITRRPLRAAMTCS